MIYVVDQRAAGVWPVSSLSARAGDPALQPNPPDPGLREPYAACPVGRWLAVADAGHDRIAIIDRRTGDTTSVVSSGAVTGPMRAPRGVAVDGGGRLLVADTGNRRVLWSTGTAAEHVAGTADPAGWTAFGQASGDGSRAVGDFLLPTSVCVDDLGRTWVTDPALRRVVVLDDATGSGWAEVELPAADTPRTPYAVAADAGAVLVTDLTRAEVWSVTPDLTPTLLVSGHADSRLTAPVAVAPHRGGIVVADAVGARIVRWSPDRLGVMTHRGELAARGRPDGAPTFSRVTGLAITGRTR